MAIEGAWAAAIFRHWVLFGLPQMSMLRNASVNRRLFEQASAALVYLRNCYDLCGRELDYLCDLAADLVMRL